MRAVVACAQSGCRTSLRPWMPGAAVQRGTSAFRRSSADLHLLPHHHALSIITMTNLLNCTCPPCFHNVAVCSHCPLYPVRRFNAGSSPSVNEPLIVFAMNAAVQNRRLLWAILISMLRSDMGLGYCLLTSV